MEPKPKLTSNQLRLQAMIAVMLAKKRMLEERATQGELTQEEIKEYQYTVDRLKSLDDFKTANLK